MKRTAEIFLEFQPYLMKSPITTADAHKQASSADKTTTDFWTKTWLANITANHKKFGSFAKNSVGKAFGKAFGKPSIIAGSGPSLKRTGPLLKDSPKDMLLISCLHNLHYPATRCRGSGLGR